MLNDPFVIFIFIGAFHQQIWIEGAVSGERVLVDLGVAGAVSRGVVALLAPRLLKTLWKSTLAS